MRRATLAAAAATGLCAALAVALGAGPAAAHNVVVDTTPGVDRTVQTAPTEVSVTFDDVVLALGEDGSSTVVQVTDEAGQEHATGCPATQDRTVTVPVSIDAGGRYTVAWRIVSADGHPTSGEFSFTYAPGDAGAQDPPAQDPPSQDSPAQDSEQGTAATGCDAGTSGAGTDEGAEGPAAGAQDDGAGAESGAQGSGSSDLLVALGIAGAVVVLAGGGVLLALRVGRRRD